MHLTRDKPTESDRLWRVGELAAATGLTVRALHHYDEIGLLKPSAHTGVGHRRYTGADVRRLHQIRALVGFGLSLAEVGAVLDGPPTDPRDLIQRQLAQVEQRIAAAYRLRHNLVDLLRALPDEGEPAAPTLIELIEVMTEMEQALTPQQFAELAEHRRRLVESLSQEELAEMAETRRRLTEQLTPAELAEMRRRRAALLPRRE
jgi:MerR family transcriptional regulator, thiopeptide resistance regulator